MLSLMIIIDILAIVTVLKIEMKSYYIQCEAVTLELTKITELLRTF